MDLILHHYDGSPFAEKARLMLGFKGLTWKSVHTPSVMPKPNLTLLTGGYRRAPVLQVGADIYCDTRCITRLLDQLQPTPSLLGADPLSALALAHWCDQTLFFLAIMSVFQPEAVAHFASSLPPDEAARFGADRAKFMAGATVSLPRISEGRPELALALTRIEQQLGDGRPYLLGTVPSLADFSAYHPLWILGRNPATAPLLEPYTALMGWRARIEAIGHGTFEELDPGKAVDLARSETPATIEKPEGVLLDRVALGDMVDVAATDYGLEPTRGVLRHADLYEIAIEREEPSLGALMVHFPRTGFQIRKVE